MNGWLVPALADHGCWGVAVLMAVVFAETGLLFGFFLPGDSLLFSAGALLAAGTWHVPWLLPALGVVGAAVLGDQLGYSIGRRAEPAVLRSGRLRSHIGPARRLFARYGAGAVVAARLVPVARTLTPVVAGAAQMPRWRFTACGTGGAVLWAGSMIGAGAVLGGVAFIARHVSLLAVAAVGLSCALAVATALWRHFHRVAASDDKDRTRELVRS